MVAGAASGHGESMPSFGIDSPLTGSWSPERGRTRGGWRLCAGMRHRFDNVARIAGGQHGRVSWRQLRDARVPASAIQRWIADGRLRPVHHGVYAVGHEAPSLHGDLMAAVLACGPGAVISHLSAAHLLGLVRRRPPRPEVTVPTVAGRRRPGLIVHRVAQLHRLDTWTWQDVPCTTVPRGLLDIAPRLPPADLGRACHEAWIRHRTSPMQVRACLARNPHKPGARKLRLVMGGDVTLSVLEDEFVALLARHHLPAPRTNVDHAGDKVDCHWPDSGLTVELLSYRFHGSRRAFEADIARRRRSSHVAFTYGDVFERPAATAAEVGHALAVARGAELHR